MKFKPLLASPIEDFSRLDYDNLLVSPKLDGIRAIVMGGVVMSRKLKPIPNRLVQHLFGRPDYEHFDGELIVGEPAAKDVYLTTYSGVMSADGEPDVRFHVFDHIGAANVDYEIRYGYINANLPGVRRVNQSAARDYDDLLRIEEVYLNEGYEGIMLRKRRGPQSTYKFGRSTEKEGTLLKLKRFVDAEAIVIGIEEEMENRNEATKDELGHTKRSSHAENKVGKGRLGALVCRTPDGVEFRIGTGFTADQRVGFWRVGEDLLDRPVKYKTFPIGVKDAPRFPVFLGWRDPIDM